MSRAVGMATGLLLTLGMLAACSAGAVSGPASTASGAGPISAVGSPATTSDSPSAAPATATGSSSASATGGVGGPQAPATTPAPSTAGTLNASSLPSISGFAPRAGDGDDGAYVPNGSAAHSIPVQDAVDSALAQRCGDADTGLPRPTAVLGGSYAAADGSVGNSVVYSFASPSAAKQFVWVYGAGLHTCLAKSSRPMVVTLSQTAPVLIDTRFYPDDGSRWTEVAKAVSNRVDVVLVQNPTGAFTLARARALGEALN